VSLALQIFRTPLSAGALALAIGAAVGVTATREGALVPATVLCATVIAIATLRQPRFGLIAFVLLATLLPFAVVPLRLVVSPTLVDVALTSVLAAWVARALHRRQRLEMRAPVVMLLIFIWLAVVALVAGLGNARIGAEQLRLFLKLVNSLLLFVAVVQIVRSTADIAQVIRTLLIGGAGAAALALAVHALPSEVIVETLSLLQPLGYPSGPAVLRPIVETDVLRATGTSVDPNVLGGMLMLVAAVLVGQLVASASVLPRIALAVAAVPILLAMGLSYSRSAWVGLAAAVLFLAITRDRRVWLVVGAGAAVLVLAPPGRAMLARLVSGFGAQDPAASLRLSEYRDALALISEYPWLGVGFGDPPRIDQYIGVSNLYLQVAEHVGLVGLSAFLIVIGLVLLRAFRTSAARTELSWGLMASLQAAMVAALVAGLFDHYFFNVRFPHMVGLFWLVLGMLSVLAGLIRYERQAGGISVDHADAGR
jgi:polysaccharide biosynthesis protein PslJ